MFGWIPIGDEEDQDDYVVEEIKKGQQGGVDKK